MYKPGYFNRVEITQNKNTSKYGQTSEEKNAPDNLSQWSDVMPRPKTNKQRKKKFWAL